jgi:hypothetical protein
VKNFEKASDEHLEKCSVITIVDKDYYTMAVCLIDVPLPSLLTHPLLTQRQNHSDRIQISHDISFKLSLLLQEVVVAMEIQAVVQAAAWPKMPWEILKKHACRLIRVHVPEAEMAMLFSTLNIVT